MTIRKVAVKNDAFIQMAESYFLRNSGNSASLVREFYLSASCIATDTSIKANYIPKGMQTYLGWVVIDPFTSECEVRRVTGISGNALTIAALAYGHALNDVLLWIDNPILYPQWLGAKGDDATDCTTAFRRMEAQLYGLGGGIAHIPLGDYVLTDYILLRDGQIWEGEGFGSRITRSTDGGILSTTGYDNVTIRDLQLDGDNADAGHSNHYGIRFRDSANIKIQNVWAHGFSRSGISGYASTDSDGNVNVTIEGCTCYDNAENGIFMIIDQDRISILNNYCYGNGVNGIALDDSHATPIKPPKLNRIIGNTCRDNTRAGIMLEGVYDSEIAGNICYNNGKNVYHSSPYSTNNGDGIYLHTAQNEILATRNDIHDNKCYTNRRNGILLIGAVYNNIHDNELIDNGDGDANGRNITLAYTAEYDPTFYGSDYNLIHDNQLLRASDVDMTIAIRVNDSYCTGNRIYRNQFHDSIGGWTPISDLGTLTRIGDDQEIDVAVKTFADGDATPDVSDRRPIYRFADSPSNTVTNFDAGYSGQVITVRFDTANTTLTDGTNILLDGSANYNPPAGTVMQLVNYQGTWYEVSRRNT